MAKKHHTGPFVARLLVDYVVKNFDYFRQNPSHLAWAMMWYEAIGRTWRINHDDYTNPKDYLLKMEDKINKADADLLYDAWGITVSNYQLFQDDPEGLGSKPDKTVDEWIQYKTSLEYPFHDLYYNKYRVIDDLLNTVGNSMSWNKNGFVTKTGPSGIDESVYAGYTRCEDKIKPNIHQNVLRYVDMLSARPDIGRQVYEYTAKAIENNVLIHNGKDFFEVVDPETTKKRNDELSKLVDYLKTKNCMFDSEEEVKNKEEKITWYPFCKNYSLLCKMPDNAHESYKKAGIEICETLLNGHATIRGSSNPVEQKKLAREFLAKWNNHG